MKRTIGVILLLAVGAKAHVSAVENFTTKPILADINDLRALNIPILNQSEDAGVGYALVNPFMLEQIQEHAHTVGKCGGFEDLSQESHFLGDNAQKTLNDLADFKFKNELYLQAPFKMAEAAKDPEIARAVEEVNEQNLINDVQWLSSYPNRNNKDAQPNKHIPEMKKRLESIVAKAAFPISVAVLSHNSTKQNSIRVHIEGSENPDEIIVLGGHLDSISGSWGGSSTAPGADDNASGSANLMEALRIIVSKNQPKRSIEFFWYAGEESGLLGSAEIAKQYKAENKTVIAVLQLDMTLFPGSGEFVIGSMTDFTSAWLREYLHSINDTYLHAKIVEDKCGYGCSDHASWHRQGYPTLLPFEASFRGSNKNIHSARDTITPELNFKHSALYTKIAVVMALDLGNSDARQPF